MKIYLIGLGNGDMDLSYKAVGIAKTCDALFVRTALTDSYKTLSSLGIEATPLDDVYEKSRNFDTLNKNLANKILSASKLGSVAYFVDGATYEDNSCKIIAQKHKDVEIIEGPSKAGYFATVFKVFGGFEARSCYDFTDYNKLSFPLIVYDIDNVFTAGQLKLSLSEVLGDEYPVKLYIGGKVINTVLCEIDFFEGYNYKTALYIEDRELTQKEKYDVNDLFEVMRFLRSEDGCPWDREQTKESIKSNLIEECYELIDAINKDDEEMMLEEIGDVFMQAVFHTVFAEERKSFNYYDVMTTICNKLISRHSHIFGKDKANTSEEVLKIWDENKKKEKKFSCGGEYVSSVPQTLPALMRAEKVMNRAAKYNFEFDNVEQIFDKIQEEIDEVRQEIKSGNTELLRKECGDLLCSAVNAVRFLGFECEETLTLTIEKFIDRFTKLEQAIIADGKDIKQITSEERERYYDAIKRT